MRNFDKFISDLRETCSQNKVKLILYPEKFILDKGEKYGGWFDGEKRELHCAFPPRPTARFKEVLLHESCHMDQWILKTKAWTEYVKNDSGGKVWKYLEGKEIKDLKRHIAIIQRMEAECENMVIEKIKKYNLPIDIKTYIKKSNSYLMLYTHMVERRKWSDLSPYKFKAIYEQMPSYKIIHNLPMTNELKDTYNRLCYKKSLNKENGKN